MPFWYAVTVMVLSIGALGIVVCADAFRARRGD